VALVDGKNYITVDFVDKALNNATVTLLVIKEKAPAPAKGFIPGFTTAAAVGAAAIALGAVGWRRRQRQA
jgi:hypothetical protein